VGSFFKLKKKDVKDVKLSFIAISLRRNTFQKPAFRNQKCRNQHDSNDVGCSTQAGIRQVFRSSFFTNSDIM
jgi:hypothetical protein